MATWADDAKSLIEMARRHGKSDDELADVMLANVATAMLPLIDRQALARALERQAVKLMSGPDAKAKN